MILTGSVSFTAANAASLYCGNCVCFVVRLQEPWRCFFATRTFRSRTPVRCQRSGHKRFSKLSTVRSWRQSTETSRCSRVTAQGVFDEAKFLSDALSHCHCDILHWTAFPMATATSGTCRCHRQTTLHRRILHHAHSLEAFPEDTSESSPEERSLHSRACLALVTFRAADLDDPCWASVVLIQQELLEPYLWAPAANFLRLRGNMSSPRQTISSGRHNGRDERQSAQPRVKELHWQRLNEGVVGCDEKESDVRVQLWRQRFADNAGPETMPTHIFFGRAPLTGLESGPTRGRSEETARINWTAHVTMTPWAPLPTHFDIKCCEPGSRHKCRRPQKQHRRSLSTSERWALTQEQRHEVKVPKVSQL